MCADGVYQLTRGELTEAQARRERMAEEQDEAVEVEEKRVPFFRTGKELRERLNGG